MIREITERLANLPIPAVLVIIAALLGVRYALRKQGAPISKSIAEIAESLAVAMALVFLLIRPFVVQAFFIPSGSMEPTLLQDDHILVNKFLYRVSDPKRGDVVVFISPPEAQSDEKDFIKRVIAVPGDTVRTTAGYVQIGDDRYNHRELGQLLGLDPMVNKIKLASDKAYVDGKVVSAAEIAAKAGNPDAKVKIVPGEVFLNGKELKEPYTAEDTDMQYPGDPRFDVQPNWLSETKDGKQVVKIPKGKLLVMGDNRNNSNDARFWGLLDRSRIQGKAMFIFWPIGRISWIH